MLLAKSIFYDCNKISLFTRQCDFPIANDCGYWTGWGAFGACSSSCGAGVRQRTRSCAGNNPGEGSKFLNIYHLLKK